MAIKTGTAKSETIKGTELADSIYGLGGNDYLYGNGGDDLIWGDAGNDSLYGGKGNDVLRGGIGSDTLWGFENDDSLFGDDGNDKLDGGSGNDKLNGGAGDDTLIHAVSGAAKTGSDVFEGGNGIDILLVKAGAATVTGAYGTVPATVGIMIDPTGTSGSMNFNDGFATTFVEQGKFAGIEKFSITDGAMLNYRGGHLDATVTGGLGADKFISGEGSEIFIGGAGSDQFIFDFGIGGSDTIVGFDAAEDVLVSFQWDDSEGNDIATRSITEANGHTIVTTSNLSGNVTHTLDIDAVGLPADIFKDGYMWA